MFEWLKKLLGLGEKKEESQKPEGDTNTQEPSNEE